MRKTTLNSGSKWKNMQVKKLMKIKMKNFYTNWQLK